MDLGPRGIDRLSGPLLRSLYMAFRCLLQRELAHNPSTSISANRAQALSPALAPIDDAGGGRERGPDIVSI